VSFADAPIGLAIIGLDGRWLEVNPALCALLAAGPEDLIASPVDGRLHPDDRARIGTVLAAYGHGELASSVSETRFVRTDGLAVWVECHLSVATDESGDPQYLIAQLVDVSERRRRREELEAMARDLEASNQMLATAVKASVVNENRYAALVDRLPETLVYVYDAEHRVKVAQGTAIASEGHDPALMIGKRPEDILDQGDAAAVQEMLEAASRGVPSHVRRRMTSSGRHLQVDVVPVEQPDDREVLVLGRDISEAVQRELELAEAADRWRAAFDGAPVAMLELSADWIVTSANPAMTALAQRPLGEIVGASWPDLLRARDGDTAAGSCGAEPRGDGSPSWVGEQRLRRPGPDVAVVVHGSVLSGGPGGGHRRLLYLIDQTAEIERHEAVRRAAARFTALVEHGSDLICVLDEELVLRFASPSYRHIFGADSAADLGASGGTRVHPDDLAIFTGAMEAVKRRPDAAVIYELRVGNTEGQWRYLEVTATNRLADPDVAGIICNARDVTERVEAATRLTHQALHDHLTGLANRALIHDRIELALARAARTERVCALLFIDLDEFKEVNDRLGHRGGIRSSRPRLDACARSSARATRLGAWEATSSSSWPRIWTARPSPWRSPSGCGPPCARRCPWTALS
jgi:PAS domain S-box-containing protein